MVQANFDADIFDRLDVFALRKQMSQDQEQKSAEQLKDILDKADTHFDYADVEEWFKNENLYPDNGDEW